MSRALLRVAAIQLDCSGSLGQVEARAIRMVKAAARRGAAVVCLPEHWIPGRRPDIEDEVPVFAELARATGSYVILGAGRTRKYGRVTVESVVVGPQGRVGTQRKVHLFGREKKLAIPGDSYSVFDLAGVKVGIAICHDLVYPEVTRILALSGAEVIFAPARIRREGIEPWELYLKARALENRVAVVSPNVFNPPRFPGGSLIVGLSATRNGIVTTRVLGRAGAAAAVLVADLHLQSMRRHRSARLRARRPDTYSALSRRGRVG